MKTEIYKVYLAGKMRGLPLYNFPAFAEAAMTLRDEGMFVFSPAERDLACGFNPALGIDEQDQDFSLEEAFAWDFHAIYRSDAIVLLPGWETSEGTKKEIVLAQGLGLPIYAYNCGLLEPIKPKLELEVKQ